ncbi:hypothetical protein C8R43DRAFT_1102371 [Mycena crocata]|nr:hypothetical protein C8R43DRAFT_1102371 [Mycena crocata]
MRMKFVVLLIAAASLVSCTPPLRKSLSPTGHRGRAVGAAYFMTNEPTGNYIVSATIRSDAKLELYEAISTASNGSGPLNGIPVQDPLLSQGSIQASAAGNFVANVNAGSKTVTVFGIDASRPARLSMIGEPVSSNGEFPTSLAINKAGNRVCVVNAGKVNGVSCYTFHAKTGLTPLKNSVRSLNLTQILLPTFNVITNEPAHIIFSADENHLIVSVPVGFLSTPGGFLAIWDIHADGSLSANYRTIVGGVNPFSLLDLPGTNALIASDPGVGYTIFNLHTNQTVSTPIPGQIANCWSVFSRESGNFYMVDQVTSGITEVHVTASLNSTIVKQYNLGTDMPIDSAIARIGPKDFIYSLTPNATAIAVLSVNGPGKAQVHQRIDLAGPAAAAKLPLHANNIQGMATFVCE